MTIYIFDLKVHNFGLIVLKSLSELEIYQMKNLYTQQEVKLSFGTWSTKNQETLG